MTLIRPSSIFSAIALVSALAACGSDEEAVPGQNWQGSDAASDAKKDTGALTDAGSTAVDSGSDSSTPTDSGASGSDASHDSGGGVIVGSNACTQAGYVCRAGDFVDPCPAAGGFAMPIYSCGAGFGGNCCTK